MPAASAELPLGRVTLSDLRPEKLTAELARVSKILGSKRPFDPVGFDHVNSTVWAIDRAGYLRRIPIRQLRRPMLISVCGVDWLLSKYPEYWEKTGAATGHFDADKAADALVSACQAMGYFDATQLHLPPAGLPPKGI